MKLKNDALQELYDTVVANTITILPFAASPIDTAFRECDEKLSESITFAKLKDLQDRNDILERYEKALLEANMKLASKNQKLEKEIEGLGKENKLLTESRDEWSKRSIENRKQIIKLEKDLDDAQKLVSYYRQSRNDWRSRAKHAEKEVEDLKSRLNSIYGNEHIKRHRDWECTLEGTFEINKDLLNKICGIGSFSDFDPEIRQKECFAEMYADMTLVDYPERFGKRRIWND